MYTEHKLAFHCGTFNGVWVATRIRQRQGVGLLIVGGGVHASGVQYSHHIGAVSQLRPHG